MDGLVDVDGTLDGLQRRLGSKYLSAYALFDVLSALVFAVGGVFLLGLYVTMSSSEVALVTAGALVFGAAPVYWGARVALRRAAPLAAWLDGPRTAAEAIEAAGSY